MNRESLRQLVQSKIGDAVFVVVSNREPYLHQFKDRKIEVMKPASGMVTAMEPIMRACQGTWIAHGAGSADRKVVDERSHVAVPPENPEYTLRRVWLTKEEEERYYYGFSNETLWPLCHIVYVRPTFEKADWEMYRQVNRKFADAVLEEIQGKKAFVWIQDYHFALLPAMIKEKRPDVTVAHFWHIPWPNPEVFRICPWGNEILEGLLANDLLGFHIRYHCSNFLQTVSNSLEARVDWERLSVFHHGGKECLVHAFPISVDFDQITADAHALEDPTKTAAMLLEQVPEDNIIALSVDRMDYTKGVPERLQALDRFLESYPEYQGRFTLIQTGSLTRFHIGKYKEITDQVTRLVEEINWKYEKDGWRPIVFLRTQISYQDVVALCRRAQILIVSSLHDGMNLVAKEFVASQIDGEGSLILSRFTGAARELQAAIQVNPYDTESFAQALHEAVTMNPDERSQRMHRLREIVEENNIYTWAGNIIQELARIDSHSPYDAIHATPQAL